MVPDYHLPKECGNYLGIQLSYFERGGGKAHLADDASFSASVVNNSCMRKLLHESLLGIVYYHA